jgi:hypothetical protein
LLIIPLAFLLYLFIRKNFIGFKDKEEKQDFNKRKRKERMLIYINRLIVIFLLLFALATPFSEESIEVDGDVSLTILADNSSSFNMFDTSIAQQVHEKIKEKMPVNLRYIASGEKSAIGDGILNNMEGDDNLLVITDGNNNYGRVLGDVILFASGLNTSINTIEMDPISRDARVRIDGPSQAIVGEENTFTVVINEVGSLPSYNLNIQVDGDTIYNEKSSSSKKFTKSFSEGYHEIKAEITLNDFFRQNNIYYKTIKVIKKPKILFVSEKTSPLLIGLKNLYEVTLKESVPDNLEDYHAVILNDIDGEKIASKVKKLTSYVSDGNGLVVIGGQNSYDKGYYQVPSYLIESLLPVQVGVPAMSPENKANIVFLIDVSDTTGLPFRGNTGYSVLDMEKSIALGLIETLRPEDSVAVLAIHGASTLVSPLARIDQGKDDMILNVRKMQPGGGTNFVPALRRASFLLEGVEGTKNIILITDGIEYSTKTATLSTISLLKEMGITTYTVGIGQYTDEPHLKRISELGGGLFFRPDETENLNLVFERSESGESDAKAAEYKLMIRDKNHWITRGDVSLDASITGYNNVVPKLGSRALVVTTNMKPVITVGNFGLGRTVAISTDDGSKWAANLLKITNSKIITRSINYAVGDPGRTLDFDVTIEDTPINKPAQINVRSVKLPKSDLDFSKISNDIYVATLYPEETGINEILGAKFAVNYNDEYLDVGMNQEFKSLVRLTDGKVFDKDDIDAIVEEIKNVSKRVKIDTVNHRWPFAVAALILLLIEIIIRRLKENIASRR